MSVDAQARFGPLRAVPPASLQISPRRWRPKTKP